MSHVKFDHHGEYAPHLVTAVVNGLSDVSSYSSGFASGDAENFAYEKNLFGRLEMCAARVFVSRHVYGCKCITDADESHCMMMLTFMGLINCIIDSGLIETNLDNIGDTKAERIRDELSPENVREFVEEILS